jgi:hypothetical protein
VCVCVCVCVCVSPMFNIIQFIEKQINAIRVLNTSSNKESFLEDNMNKMLFSLKRKLEIGMCFG